MSYSIVKFQENLFLNLVFESRYILKNIKLRSSQETQREESKIKFYEKHFPNLINISN